MDSLINTSVWVRITKRDGSDHYSFLICHFLKEFKNIVTEVILFGN